MYIKNDKNQMPRLWAISEKLLRSKDSKTAFFATFNQKEHRVTNLTEAQAEPLSKHDKVKRLLVRITFISWLFLLCAKKFYHYRYKVKNAPVTKSAESTNRVSLQSLIHTVPKSTPSPAKPDSTPPAEPSKSSPPQGTLTPSVPPVTTSPSRSEEATRIDLKNEEDFSYIEKFDLLSSAFKAYKTCIDEPAWQADAAKNFLHREMEAILLDLNALFPQSANDPDMLNLLEGLQAQVILFQEDLISLDASFLSSKPPGIENRGNTCYLNAALQSLLALGHFDTYFPKHLVQFQGETSHQFDLRKSIYDAFQNLIEGRRNHLNPSLLGDQVAELRKRIFQAGFEEGGFIFPEDEYDMQDSGSFFELLLFISGQQMREKSEITALDENKIPLNYTKVDELPLSVPQLKLKGSVQEAVDAYSKPKIEDADGWRVDLPEESQSRVVPLKKIETKLLGVPPNLLIMRVESRIIDPSIDGTIDAKNLFTHNPDDLDAHYELVGFCQNISQVHWVSVVKTVKGAWVNCNDAHVEPVLPTDSRFQRPASYVVYKKMRTR